MIKEEGMFSFFRSFPITYFMNAPLAGLIVSVNESLKTITEKPFFKKHNFASHFLCAGVAGAIAAILTNPLDIIKTRIQT